MTKLLMTNHLPDTELNILAQSEDKLLNLQACSVDFEAAPADGNEGTLRRFTMTAYTGGPMQLAGWRYPVVVDLQGMQMGKQRRPILLDHTRDVDFVVGQTDSIAVMNNALIVAGQVMGDSPKARQVIALNDKGFAWQASIGARADQVEFVAEGKTTVVNGQEVTGPINVARRSMLGEVSFVVLGADDNTSAQIAASQVPSSNLDGDTSPTAKPAAFDAWLGIHGFDTESLTASQTDSLRQMFAVTNSKIDLDLADNSQIADEIPSPQVNASQQSTTTQADAVANLRASMANELKRIAAIRRICNGRDVAIEARAIAEGWDQPRTELEMLRSQRPQAPAIQSVDRSITGQVLEAACMLSARHADVETIYEERTLEAAKDLGC